jgi:hypothetical protein
MRTVAFDGCNSLRVPDTERNRSWLGRIRYRMGFAGYPTIRMMTVIETGTRAVLGAVLGSAATETKRPWPDGCWHCLGHPCWSYWIGHLTSPHF